MFFEWLINEADQSDWHAMLNAINPSSLRYHGKNPQEDHLVRIVAADHLQDADRDEEAELLRNTDKHVYRDEGKIRSSHDLAKSFQGQINNRSVARYGLNYSDVQYIVTALFSSMDEEGNPLEENYSIYDISPETLAAMVSDWRSFWDHATSLGLIDDEEKNDVAHDFWLTRNGHGSGFWSKDYTNGKELTQLAKRYGEYDLYIGDDEKIHGSYHVI